MHAFMLGHSVVANSFETPWTSLPGFSVYWISQARILKLVAMSSFRDKKPRIPESRGTNLYIFPSLPSLSPALLPSPTPRPAKDLVMLSPNTDPQHDPTSHPTSQLYCITWWAIISSSLKLFSASLIPGNWEWFFSIQMKPRWKAETQDRGGWDLSGGCFLPSWISSVIKPWASLIDLMPWLGIRLHSSKLQSGTDWLPAIILSFLPWADVPLVGQLVLQDSLLYLYSVVSNSLQPNGL